MGGKKRYGKWNKSFKNGNICWIEEELVVKEWFRVNFSISR